MKLFTQIQVDLSSGQSLQGLFRILNEKNWPLMSTSWAYEIDFGFENFPIYWWGLTLPLTPRVVKTSALPMGFPPWLSHIQIDYNMMVKALEFLRPPCKV